MYFDTVIFDLDGTLTDSVEGIVNSVSYALEKGGYPPLDRASLRACVGPPLALKLQELLLVSRDESLRLLELYREYFAVKGIFENSLYDGILPMLKTLCKDGCRLLLCTGKPEKFARIILEHFSIAAYFADVLGPTLDGRYNDKAEGLAVLLERSGGKRNLFVGDRMFDTEAARKNVIPCAGVLWGCGSQAELEEHGADYIVNSVAQLIGLIYSGAVK